MSSASLDHRGTETTENTEDDEVDETLNRLTEQVIGAAIEVHRHLGAGFLESTYEKAMCIELGDRQVRFVPQAPVELFYKDRSLGEGKVDLLVEDRLVVELKAVSHLNDAHKTQVLAYLKCTGLPLGLLIKFHEAVLKDGIRRVAN